MVNDNFDDIVAFGKNDPRYRHLNFYCKCCGKPLLHQDARVFITEGRVNKGLKLLVDKKRKNKVTFLNVRNYFGVDYPICKCYDCIIKEHPEVAGKEKYIQPFSFASQYAYEIPDEIFKQITDKHCRRTEQSYIEKFGEKEGLERWKSYCDKQAKTNTFEYKQEKYGWSREQFNEYNASRAVTRENLIKRHGEEEGLMIWESYREQQRYTTTREYFIETYGEEEGRRKYKNFEDKRYIYGFSSEMANDCFDALDKFFPGEDTRYDRKIEETKIGPYYLDYYNKDRNIVVEFYGDFWHANPKKYSPGDTVHINLRSTKVTPVEDIWARDERRRDDIIKMLGCRFIIIWESDWKKYKEELFTPDFLKQFE